MTLSSAKTLGGVGSILIILSAIPSVGWVLALAGFIMVLFAVKNVSDSLADQSIFNNMLYSVLAAIAGVLVGGLFIAASVVHYFGFNFSSIGSMPPATFAGGDFVSMVLSVILGLVVMWIALVVSAVFLRRSYWTMGTKLNVKMFDTTALLYLIGAATSIILVGFVVLLVAEILQIVSFFSLPESPPPAVTTPQPRTA